MEVDVVDGLQNVRTQPDLESVKYGGEFTRFLQQNGSSIGELMQPQQKSSLDNLQKKEEKKVKLTIGCRSR